MGFIDFCWDRFSAGLLACNGPIWQYGPLEYTGLQHIALFFGGPVWCILTLLWHQSHLFPGKRKQNVDNSEGTRKAETLPTFPFWIFDAAVLSVQNPCDFFHEPLVWWKQMDPNKLVFGGYNYELVWQGEVGNIKTIILYLLL